MPLNSKEDVDAAAEGDAEMVVVVVGYGDSTWVA